MRNREDFGKLTIIYGGRSKDDLCFKEDLFENWPKVPNTEVHVTIDRDVYKRQEPTVSKVDTKICSGCGLCVPVCPYKAITLETIQERRAGKTIERLVANVNLSLIHIQMCIRDTGGSVAEDTSVAQAGLNAVK